MSPTTVFWTSGFLDLAPSDFEAGLAFWSAVTGYALSPGRGEHDEFRTLEPLDGDDFLRVQRLASGPSRVHLDLHSADPRALADRAVELGARELADLGYVVLRSPSGLTFCCVSHPASLRPSPAVWHDGARSRVDQVCLDIAPADYDLECAFWQRLTGWEHRTRSGSEFSSLARPPGMPLRLLLQRLDVAHEPDVGTSAHLDLACDDRLAETARHQALGARLLRRHEHFTVLLDPTGSPYCLTDRDVDTGLLH